MKNIFKTPHKNWLPLFGGLFIIVILALLWQPFSQIGSDPAVIQAWLEPFGSFAPLVFFLINVIQIVVAPIPGYPVQILGGWLYGFIFGTIYTVSGMVVGGTLAAWLGRRLGRPWLEKQLSPKTLERWEAITHIDSFWVWWLILLVPIGDFIYFIAGLSKIRLRTFALAILTSRGLFTAFIVWISSKTVGLSLNWLAALWVVAGLVVLVGFSQRARIEVWARDFIHRQTRLNQEGDQPEG